MDSDDEKLSKYVERQIVCQNMTFQDNKSFEQGPIQRSNPSMGDKTEKASEVIYEQDADVKSSDTDVDNEVEYEVESALLYKLIIMKSTKKLQLKCI